MSLSRYWGLVCLSQVLPDKLLSLLLKDSGVLEDRWGMCSSLTARWLTVMSRASIAPMVAVLATGIDSHGHKGCAGFRTDASLNLFQHCPRSPALM